VRRIPGREEEDTIQRQLVVHLDGREQMAMVNGVKGAPQYA
jgi:hypothetical protein